MLDNLLIKLVLYLILAIRKKSLKMITKINLETCLCYIYFLSIFTSLDEILVQQTTVSNDSVNFGTVGFDITVIVRNDSNSPVLELCWLYCAGNNKTIKLH